MSINRKINLLTKYINTTTTIATVSLLISGCVFLPTNEEKDEKISDYLYTNSLIGNIGPIRFYILQFTFSIYIMLLERVPFFILMLKKIKLEINANQFYNLV